MLEYFKKISKEDVSELLEYLPTVNEFYYAKSTPNTSKNDNNEICTFFADYSDHQDSTFLAFFDGQSNSNLPSWSASVQIENTPRAKITMSLFDSLVDGNESPRTFLAWEFEGLDNMKQSSAVLCSNLELADVLLTMGLFELFGHQIRHRTGFLQWQKSLCTLPYSMFVVFMMDAIINGRDIVPFLKAFRRKTTRIASSKHILKTRAHEEINLKG